MALPGLTLIVQTRAIDRLHYALMLAAANAALGGPTTLFFAVEGVAAFETGGWGALPTAAGEPGADFLQRLEDVGVAHPDDLLDALAEMGARLAVCDSALAVAGLSEGDLRPEPTLEVTGLADILAASADGRIVYV